MIEYNCKAAKLKDSFLSKIELRRHKRDIDGNDLPPLPLTSSSNDNGVPLTYAVEEGGADSAQQDRGNDYTGTGTTRNYDYRNVSPVTTTSPGMVNVGSDPQIVFRSHIGSARGQYPARTASNAQDNSRTSTSGGGYRYTSTVYSGPGSRTAYRYRPPYDQLGNRNNQGGGYSQTQYNTRTGTQQYPYRGQQGTRTQTQYSPYVGSGVNYNPSGSRVQYIGGSGRYPLYNRNERVYGGSSNYIPNRGVLSNDRTCPTDSIQVYINNMGCTQAINTLGSFICYNYERVSQECCERCLSLKKSINTGCEYGDWSYQCRNMEPFDCYNDRNRDICCETCRIHKERQTEGLPRCEYGDLTPRCQIIREKRHLCYLPENQRLCCLTCPSLAEQNNTVCKWGDQNPELCTPFDQQNQLRINCYVPTVQQICCGTCNRLKLRVSNQVAGCEYGDRPVSFSTPFGLLDCGLYIRRFGMDVCSNTEVSTHCCYTCYRYRQSRPGTGKK